MAKNTVSDWDTTANNNTDVGGISLAENVMTAPLVNNAFREMMAQLKAGVNIRLSGTTDNTLVRFDGTSGLIQGSAVSVTDTGIMSTNKYRATDTNGVTLASVAHGFQIGPDNASNLAFDDGEVQSRNNGAAADIAINRLGGAVNIASTGAATNVLGSLTVAQGLTASAGINFGADDSLTFNDTPTVGSGEYTLTSDGSASGTTLATGMLRLANTNGVTLSSTLHGFQIGSTTGSNLVADVDEIQSRNNGAAAALSLNRLGGAVNIGSSGADTTINGGARLSSTTAVGLASTGHAFQIGPTNGANLAASPSAIQGRNNGAAATVAINGLGGDVTIASTGAATNVLGSLNVAQASAFSGKMTVSAEVAISAGANPVTVAATTVDVSATTLFKVSGATNVDISGVTVDISGSTLALEGDSLSLTSSASPISLASHTKALSLETGTYANGGGSNGTNIGTSSYNVSKAGTSTATCMSLYNGNGLVGSITISGTTTTYATTSDERLKTDFEGFDAGEILDQISMYKYAWKADGSIGYGPKAQELHGIFPVAVSEGSVGDQPGDETFEPWQYDAAKLVPLLIRETQSLRLRVAALEAASN
jgi:hypothetical protein